MCAAIAVGQELVNQPAACHSFKPEPGELNTKQPIAFQLERKKKFLPLPSNSLRTKPSTDHGVSFAATLPAAHRTRQQAATPLSHRARGHQLARISLIGECGTDQPDAARARNATFVPLAGVGNCFGFMLGRRHGHSICVGSLERTPYGTHTFQLPIPLALIGSRGGAESCAHALGEKSLSSFMRPLTSPLPNTGACETVDTQA